MYERLVLRYSGTSTIQAHVDVISDVGYTWWGWWTKDEQEPVPLEFFRWAGETASRERLRIGLVDRKDGRCAVGLCAGMEYNGDGSRLPAPDGGTATPDYYKTEKCGAWFRLERIEPLSVRDYEREFGEIPVGDATVYALQVDEDDHRELIPKPNWSFRTLPVEGSLILHLSDLHYGDLHGYQTARPRPGTGVGGPFLADRISQVIDASDGSIGVVLVTGDLVSRGQDIAPTLEHFTDLVDRLRKRFGLLREQFVIVPGNHDFLTVTDYVQMKLDYKHEKEFKHFIKDFYGRPTVADLEQPFRVLLGNGVELVGVALNSARLRDEHSRDYGFVAKHRYERLMRLLREAVVPLGNDVVMRPTVYSALLHHHLLPVNAIEPPSEGRHVSVTVDAGEIIGDFVAEGVQVVFHGHQHLPFLGSVRASRPANATWDMEPFDRELLVVGGGSAGVRRSSLPDAFPFNSVGVYCLREDASEMSVALWRYLPGVECAQVCSRSVRLSPGLSAPVPG